MYKRKCKAVYTEYLRIKFSAVSCRPGVEAQESKGPEAQVCFTDIFICVWNHDLSERQNTSG